MTAGWVSSLTLSATHDTERSHFTFLILHHHHHHHHGLVSIYLQIGQQTLHLKDNELITQENTTYNNWPNDRRFRTDAGCNDVAIFGVSPSISYKDDRSPRSVSSPQLMSDKNELNKFSQHNTDIKITGKYGRYLYNKKSAMLNCQINQIKSNQI